MKRIILGALVVFSFLTTGMLVPRSAWAGKEVNNAAGLSEQNLVFAFDNFAPLVAFCLKSPACGLAPDEATSATRAVAPLTEKTVQLRFATEKELGTVPYLVAGAVWTVNQDLLWKDGARTVAYSLVDALMLLIEIADARTQLLSASTLDKVRNALSRDVIERRLEFTEATIGFRFWSGRAKAQAFLDDGSSVDLGATLAPLIGTCAGSSTARIQILEPVARSVETQGKKVQLGFLAKVRQSCGGDSSKWMFDVVLEIDNGAAPGQRLKIARLESLGEE